MAYCKLHIYNGPSEDNRPTIASNPNDANSITLSVGDVLPLLADAVDSRRTWLRDFENDEITISSDLYEVLLAYQHFRRPGA